MDTPKSGKGRKNKLGFLDDPTLDYYRRVYQTITSEIEGDEKELFLNNVISQLETEALRVCQNQTASRFVERLMEDAKPSHILQLLSAFKSDWTTALIDRFASHVVQDLISLSPKCVQEEGDDVRTSMISLMEEIHDHVSENLGTLMIDTYGSHVLRVLLEVLSGIEVSENIIRSRVSKVQKKEERLWPKKENPPEEYGDWFNSLVKKLFAFCNYSEHLMDPSSSPLYQTVLLILDEKDQELCQKHMKKIQKKAGLLKPDEEEEKKDEEESLPPLVQDEVGSYLVEQIISITASRGKLTKIYDRVFKGRLLYYAVGERANFVLQKLIDRISDIELFEEVFDDLSSHIEDILAMHHIGILTKMAASCVRLHTRQEKFMKVLMDAFHCSTPEDRQTALSPLLLTLSTYDVYYGTDKPQEENEENEPRETKEAILTTINYHGSVLVQQLLRFGKTRLMVASLLQLKPVELKTLSCDSCGSHVIDVFCESDTVGEKKRDLLLEKLKPVLLDIGCDRNGSRTLESVWKNCSVKQKTLIAEELSKQEDKLRSSRFGHFVHRNFSISTFKHKRSAWINEQGLANKKKKLLNFMNADLSKKKTANPKVEEEEKQKLEEDGEEERQEEGKNEKSSGQKKKNRKRKKNETNIKTAQPSEKTFTEIVKKKKRKG